MEETGLAITIVVVNFVIGIAVLIWCNAKIKELTDPDNWKK